MISNKKIIRTAYYIINDDPKIITVWNFLQRKSAMDALLMKFSGKKTYFIFRICWSLELKIMVKFLKYKIKKYQKKYPKYIFIFLCNSKREYYLFQKNKIQSIFCNHNVFLDEKIFKIIKNESKKFDAIYNAQMALFKRHYLANKINNLALITYFDGVNSSKIYYYIIDKLLSNALWLNKPNKGENKYIDNDDVSKYLNQAKVGLCLSRIEGGMNASTEYLLCGIPVVSTKSKGGRDVFFDKEYVKIVKSNSKSVKNGVNELINRNIDPQYIRKKTIEKIEIHRERFKDLIQSIYDREGVNKNFRKEWEKVFINKMVIWKEI